MARTCSYSGDPGASDLDKVRYLTGDTDCNSFKISDQEIEYLLDTYGTAEKAAYYGIVNLTVKYAGLMSKSVGSVRLEYSEIFDHYTQLAKTMGLALGISSGMPLTGPPLVESNALAPPLPLSDVNWHPGQPEYYRHG